MHLSLRLLPPAALVALTAATSASAASPALGSAPSTWQCGSTYTADVSTTVNLTVTVAGQPVATTAIDGHTVTFPAPSPAFASGPSYPVVQAGGTTIGVIRDGCFSILPPTLDQDPGISEVTEQTFTDPTRVFVVSYGPNVPTSMSIDGIPASDFVSGPNGVSCVDASSSSCPQPVLKSWLSLATMPAGANAHRFASVTLSDGTATYAGQTAASNSFEPYRPSSIALVTPVHGPLDGGNAVTVTVAGDWITNPTVTIDGKPATSVTTNSSVNTADGTFGEELITAVVPQGTNPGAVDLTVSGASRAGRGLVSASPAGSDDYTYDGSPASNAPTISAVRSAAVSTEFGGLLQVRGAFLGDNLTTITVGGKATAILFRSDAIVLAYVPALAPGSYPIVVTTPVGSVTATGSYLVR